MFGSIGFGRSLAALLWMSTILCAVIGAMRREPPFDAVLNHWDEMVAYAALCSARSSAARPCCSSEIAIPRRSYADPYEISSLLALEFISDAANDIRASRIMRSS